MMLGTISTFIVIAMVTAGLYDICAVNDSISSIYNIIVSCILSIETCYILTKYKLLYTNEKKMSIISEKIEKCPYCDLEHKIYTVNVQEEWNNKQYDAEYKYCDATQNLYETEEQSKKNYKTRSAVK